MKAELKGDAMLKERILESMLNMYRPPREQGPVTKAFIRKFNIVDPLLPTNNLGKSINIASKYRIREALLHGSRVLNSIFAQVMLILKASLPFFWLVMLHAKLNSSPPARICQETAGVGHIARQSWEGGG